MIDGGGGRPARNFTRHDVHRPRPPRVAVMSTPAACAALRIVVPGATVSVRRAAASPGSVRIVSATAMASHSSGMLAPMEISVESMRCIASLGGFACTHAQLVSGPPRLGCLLSTHSLLHGVAIETLEQTPHGR